MQESGGPFGARLAALRLARGMKQQALAALVPMDSTYLNKVEKGKRPPPTAEKVLALIDALQLTSAESYELLRLAGYSSLALPPGTGPTYSSPALPARHSVWYDELRPLMDSLTSAQQAEIVSAIQKLAAALRPPSPDQHPSQPPGG